MTVRGRAETRAEARADAAKRLIARDLTEAVRESVRNSTVELTDEEVQLFIDDRILAHPSREGLSPIELISVAETVFYRTRRELSVLQPFADDPDVTEIMANGTEGVFVERRGALERVDAYFESTEELEDVIRRIAAKVHREVNELSPILDARLLDGSRVNAVYKNIALGGPTLTIRRFPKSAITMEDLISYGSITGEAAAFLTDLVKAGYNIFISGGTSSGKTTFLNALSNFIPRGERVVTIEDTAELQIMGIENLVRLECRGGGLEGRGEVTMRQLIRSSLRMRPNRIIVGEVRGEEVLDMIQAMNTGHAGSLSTGHGNSPQGMIYRLEAMFLQAADFPIDAIRRQIAEAIDIIVHLGRLPGGDRAVQEIAEIADYKNGEIVLARLFAREPKNGLVKKSGLTHQEKLRAGGEV